MLFSHLKVGHPAVCDNMNGLEHVMLNEVSQEKVYDTLICGT